MKLIKSTPKDKGFFETYAKLIITLKTSGYAAQVISAFTEVGGIYAVAYITLTPIIPDYAMYVAAIIAVIGTAVIELGLRQLLPHTVDSVLYKRFTGLHLPITVLIWLSALLLIACSGILSFQNSKTIVAQITPQVAEDTIMKNNLQSTYNADVEGLQLLYKGNKEALIQQYASLVQATNLAYSNQISSQQRAYTNLKNKERRTGQSFATAKDQVKAKIASIKAEQAMKVAELESRKAEELNALQNEHKTNLKKHKAQYDNEVGTLNGQYQTAQQKREHNVAAYGGGLAYFTIVCLVILIVSIVLDRIHKKGSGIEEKISLSQYDISPSAWIEFKEAVRERVQWNIRSRINAFAEATPPAELPVAKAPVYDATAITEQSEKVKYEEEDDKEEKIIYLPRRRRIGFNSEADDGKEISHATHEISRAIKGTPKSAYETPDLRQLKQRLKDYKKRLGRHQQKAQVQQRNKGMVNKRTQAAIDNNQKWIAHYVKLIEEAERSIGTP